MGSLKRVLEDLTEPSPPHSKPTQDQEGNRKFSRPPWMISTNYEPLSYVLYFLIGWYNSLLVCEPVRQCICQNQIPIASGPFCWILHKQT